MKLEMYKNQSGVTLVELLGVLSLVAIVIALSTSIITQLLTNQNSSTHRGPLQQSTNTLVTELRNRYYIESENKLEGSSFTLCFNKIDEITSLSVSSAGKEFPIRDNCIEEVPKQSNLPVTITTTNIFGQQLSIQTTFRSPPTFATNIERRKIDFSNPDDFDQIIDKDEDDFAKGDTQTTCNFNGNTSFEQEVISTSNSCSDPKVINGSAWFLNPITIGSNVHFSIEQQLIADSSINLESNAELIIQQNTMITGGLDLSPNSRLLVSNLYVKNNLSMESNSYLTSSGSVRIDGSINVEKNNSVQINSNFYANGPLTIRNATITTGRDAFFNNSISLNQDASLIIHGDAYFSNEIQGQGSICIKGKGHFSSNVDNRINIQENALDCN